MARKPGQYSSIISKVFFDKFDEGATRIDFVRQDLADATKELDHDVKNLGDILYYFRYRVKLPKPIRDKAPDKKSWLIMPNGPAKYTFLAARFTSIEPNPQLSEIKIPDATPGLITTHAMTDEQALLARVRYNRLLDIFSGVTCYSLQNHLRTQVDDVGQLEIDEIYVGVDKFGAQYVLPVQAKGGSDKLSVVQIAQDAEFCAARFPSLIHRLIAVQFLEKDLIVMFELHRSGIEIRVLNEKHYRLVDPAKIDAADLLQYRSRVPRSR